VANAQVARPAAANETGIYAGVGLGQTKAQDACSGIAGFTGSCDDKDQSYKLFVGYDFNRNFAAEVGYVDLGSISATGQVGAVPVTASADATAFELVGVGKLPLSNNFSLIGKLGVVRWDVDSRATAGAVSASTSDTGTDLTFGFGVRYAVTRNWMVQAEWQRYNDIGNNNVGDGNVDVLGVSVLFKF
jgi:OOP family OmpA-OmpF porin